MSINSLRKQFIAGTYTPTQAIDNSFAVIAEKDAEIHAFLDVYPQARVEAEAATLRFKEEGDTAPVLLGIPVAIKNNILIQGKKATGGSKILENYIAPASRSFLITVAS